MTFKLIMTAFFALTTVSTYAQKDAGIKALINQEGGITLPTSVKAISGKINVKGRVSTEGTEQTFCSWLTPAKLSINSEFASEDRISYLILQSEDNAVLSGLPYGLVLNASTLDECAAKFKADNPVKSPLYVSEGSPEAGNRLSIKKGKYYIGLLFDAKNKLTMIQLSDFNLEAAN